MKTNKSEEWEKQKAISPKKTYQISHCGMKNGKSIEVSFGDKVGFICDECNGLFEIDYDGKITRNPIKYVKISGTRKIYEVSSPTFNRE